jgi:hypothetical protein
MAWEEEMELLYQERVLRGRKVVNWYILNVHSARPRPLCNGAYANALPDLARPVAELTLTLCWPCLPCNREHANATPGPVHHAMEPMSGLVCHCNISYISPCHTYM